jgi:hypothetical protein
MTDFSLTEHDKASPLWLRLKIHLQDRLAELRHQNDRPNLTEQQTALLRGQIYGLKDVIALDADRPVIKD